ncbi:TetR/AcrR family transcriptional regulator [Enterobacter roggenkampii]|uniref:TetR/AcrR family transcriptional regulator n=1 Tax=Enterobacter roggenkampii TaxID=1812935 RepID=UPI000DA183FE|nr:TetR/AcrR family transcriptional regulator [Enterobacter roggenkampii]
MSDEETTYLRQPSQRRGHQRVEKILAAAAEIICESSLDKLTVQTLARRSKTSPGSLYHFFSDMESVKSLLLEGYNNKITAMFENIRDSRSELSWRQLPSDRLVHKLFTPYAEFIIENRAYLPLLYEKGINFEQSIFLSHIAEIISFRVPDKDKDGVTEDVRFMHAMAAGTLQQAFQQDQTLPYAFIPRILQTLTLYLAWLESVNSHSQKNAQGVCLQFQP